MPKNIVICCDGTGNKFCDVNTNVIKLYQILDLDSQARQVAYYHAGLGTLGAPNALSRFAQWWTKVQGLAFGYGVTNDIGEAYRYLMDTFEPEDKLFLFGFSRGAYIVRALAGLLHMFGLIRPGDYNLIPYATGMLKRKQDRQTFAIAADFKRTFSRQCKPYFIGVWDTVSSVGWVWDPLHIPYTAKDPDLHIGRHAVSIDERRCFFRQNLWSAPLTGQDIKQVWFAGVHCDVGGGYRKQQEIDLGLPRITLEWMIREARVAGLLVHDDRVDRVLGLRDGVGPNAAGTMHNSLRDGEWFLLEPLPHLYTDMSCDPPRRKIKFPFGRRRIVPHGSTIHESVLERMKIVKGYTAPNIPQDRQIEPWHHTTAQRAGPPDAGSHSSIM